MYYPPNYDPKIQYPLLIQTHGFDPQSFTLDGISANFAAQAVAARGIMVLQVAENVPIGPGIQEWTSVRAGYEAIIDLLDQRHLIDRERIGLQGWSRTGPYVGYMLTHSDYHFAAAALTDTTDFGWWYFVANGGQSAESEIGAPPFGEGLAAWMQTAPTFNLDRVQAPVFMWSANSVVGQWDWYSILHSLKKPAEYWYLPDGAHEPFKIGERINMSEHLVDWFDFWLNGHEDPDPRKRDRYIRWREMRTLHDVDMRNPRPPLLNWTSSSAADSPS